MRRIEKIITTIFNEEYRQGQRNTRDYIMEIEMSRDVFEDYERQSTGPTVGSLMLANVSARIRRTDETGNVVRWNVREKTAEEIQKDVEKRTEGYPG